MLIWYFVHVLSRRLICWIYYKSSQFKNTIQVVKISMYINGSDYIPNSSASKNKTQCILFKYNYTLKVLEHEILDIHMKIYIIGISYYNL